MNDKEQPTHNSKDYLSESLKQLMDQTAPASQSKRFKVNCETGRVFANKKIVFTLIIPAFTKIGAKIKAIKHLDSIDYPIDILSIEVANEHDEESIMVVEKNTRHL
ncbi:hypothetical protein [Pseudalkalibacillus decolorationis]|uniref:hypothetical protein n=1 Tax=Pseudalkalibacillus decolorationis TaxID=163879 RepID=UPI0021480F11|nr:hypothetical protein [Pseudalkalibacillus decolorationis]